MNLFPDLHKFHSGLKKGKFVNQRSKKNMDNVTQLNEQYTQTASSSIGDTSIPDEKHIFNEASGGWKKGRIFGMGFEATRARAQQHQLTSSSSPSKVAKLQMKLIKMEASQKKSKKKLEKKEKKYRNREDTLTSMIQILAQSIGGVPSLPTLAPINDDSDDDFVPPPVDHHPSNDGQGPPPSDSAPAPIVA